jgi:hypothetical protein
MLEMSGRRDWLKKASKMKAEEKKRRGAQETILRNFHFGRKAFGQIFFCVDHTNLNKFTSLCKNG